METKNSNQEKKEINLIKHEKISGLYYADNIITIEEENELLNEIKNEIWLDDLSRRVQHYGYKYNYKKRKIDKNDYLGNLPKWTINLENKIFDLVKHSNIDLSYDNFDQLIINEYKKDQGISAHIDCVPCFKDGIVSVTIANYGIMTFKNINSNESIDVKLKRRSIAILTGDSRYKWTHEICKGKNKNFCNLDPRISLTFRKCILDK